MSDSLRLDPRALGEPVECALIGVSGGRDSVALLHALHERRYKNLVVCHLDHGWRKESGEEAQFVRELARIYGLPVRVEQLPAAAMAHGGSQETVGREARFSFFARAAEECGALSLYLAHHADDQVETTLHHFFRGTGPNGIAGMLPVSWRTEAGTQLCVRRPLLGTWRHEIDAYIADSNLEFCEDPSNTDPRHTRNRLRHTLLPELERAFGRDVRRSIWRVAEIAAAENEVLAAHPALRDLGPQLELTALRGHSLALQRRVLFTWMRQQGVPDVGFKEVEKVRELLEKKTPAKINLPGGIHARRRAGRLFLETPPPAA